MTPIGKAGRRARALAQNVQGDCRTSAAPPHASGSARESCPLLMRQSELGPPEPNGEQGTASAPAEMAASEIGRETSQPSAQDVAERVYRIFVQRLRLERERLG